MSPRLFQAAFSAIFLAASMHNSLKAQVRNVEIEITRNPNAPGFKFQKEAGSWFCDSACIKENFKYQVVGISGPNGSGTGTIVGLKDGAYAILTSNHVINLKNSSADEYEVYSFISKKYYPLSSVETPKDGIDIAVATFRAEESFHLNPINMYNIAPFSGVLGHNQEWDIEGDGARSAGISMPTASVTVPIFRFEEFVVQDRAHGNRDGYEFLYNASTVPGMSGGPIVGWRVACFAIPNGSQKGQFVGAGYFSLIAIHGRSEEYHSGGRSGLSMAVPVDLIRDYLDANSKRLGIPVTGSWEYIQTINTQYCPQIPPFKMNTN